MTCWSSRATRRLLSALCALVMALVACGPTTTLRAPMDLTPREHREIQRLQASLPAPCPDVAKSLEGCLSDPSVCPSCTAASRWLTRRVREGYASPEIDQAYAQRFPPKGGMPDSSPPPPSKGSANARVTIVEFADFQCSACVRFSKALAKELAARGAEVRLLFRHYPLEANHPDALIAALAAVAADFQGQFWPMHDKLMAMSPHLDADALKQAARELGLDLARFDEDRTSARALQIVRRDQALGKSLGVDSTPSIFINGEPLKNLNYLSSEIEAELRP